MWPFTKPEATKVKTHPVTIDFSPEALTSKPVVRRANRLDRVQEALSNPKLSAAKRAALEAEFEAGVAVLKEAAEAAKRFE